MKIKEAEIILSFETVKNALQAIADAECDKCSTCKYNMNSGSFLQDCASEAAYTLLKYIEGVQTNV